MSGQSTEELTAAECAARTGLTVRALRVYEDYGLIAPKRSANGWRYYGAAELVRLNTIGLLKTAGLSLSQIHQVTSQGGASPPLQHLLKMQVETWKERRIWAEHGQGVAEAALQNLATHHTLSVDELCGLVRSLEMSDQAGDGASVQQTRPTTSVPPAVLGRYPGHYRISDLTLLTITLDGQKLLAQSGSWPPVPLAPESETEFSGFGGQSRYTFQVDAGGHAAGVTISANGTDVMGLRIDPAAAEDIRARLAARIRDNKPVAGSEAALRRLIEGLRNGTPDFEEMSPAFAAVCRRQLPQLQMIAKYLGAILSVEFKGVGRQGWDSYEVRRENGVALWRIAFSEGVITGAIGSFADGP